MQLDEPRRDQHTPGALLPDTHDCLQRLIVEHGDVHIDTLVELITLTSQVEAGLQSSHYPN